MTTTSEISVPVWESDGKSLMAKRILNEQQTKESGQRIALTRFEGGNRARKSLVPLSILPTLVYS